MWVWRIDSDGFYIEPVEISEGEEIPKDCVEVEPPPYFKAYWNGASWKEGLTQAEIDAIKNTPLPPTPIEKLAKDQADLMFQLVMKGVL
ncbi:hypothetical protein [Rossellomorea sp. BNER]|uniref:hypothetical protein n=1 Tax=Rossellomorea sp. BNER TaxID=2962031 RepID=UPI003AF20F86|nr:hypothetical protein [Rossellomorea sp. BNER]